jgi:uncharacterized repeat protein (TIGR01451 family)
MFSLNFLFNQKEQAMKYCSRWYRSVLAGIALIAGLGLFTSSALAQGTAPGTDITNQATLNYAVGGVGQTAIPSNTTTFKVDRLVRVTVAEVGATPTSALLNTNSVTTFTVTNTGNLAQAYLLSGVDTAAGQTVTLGSLYTDNLALPSCTAFADVNGNNTYESATDTALAITTLNPGVSQTVFVVCAIPNTATIGQVAVVSLTATTAETAGCTATGAGCTATVATALAAPDPTLTNIDIVFGDTAGSEVATAGILDIARDGKHSARDAYVIAAPTLAVTKTQTLLCDPVNFNSNPRAIPGAYVRYEITVANTGTASATLTNITDALNTNLNIDANLATATGAACPGPAESAAGSGFKLTCVGGLRGCVATPVFFTTTSSVDGIDFAAPNITATFATALPAEATVPPYAAGELKAGESIVIRYNAIIK